MSPFERVPQRRELFACVEQCLALTLRRGDNIIMDDVRAHKDGAAQEAIDAPGARLYYLPPYSPVFNPIESIQISFKAILRKCTEYTEDALRRRAGQFVRRLQAESCVNFFAHASYVIRSESD